jgi:uncharacterized protein YndB with AHSA1/START domain
MDFGKAARETVVIHAVERELAVPGDPEEAWEAVADQERLGDWLGGEVEMEPVPGGDFRIRFDDGGERVGFVEELDPDGYRFSFWWRQPEDELATRVEISLDEAEEGTIIRVVETSPMARLDAVGIPLPGHGIRGPLSLAFA